MKLFNLPDKPRPPLSVRALDSWVHDAEEDTGVAPKRLGWLVASTVVVAALQRSLHADQQPIFLVTGSPTIPQR